jgi:hypothetical protein
VQRHLRAQAVADEHRIRRALGIEHRAEVGAPVLERGAPCRLGAAVSAQVHAQHGPVRWQRARLRELGPARGVARQAMQQQHGAGAAAALSPPRHRRAVALALAGGFRHRRDDAACYIPIMVPRSFYFAYFWFSHRPADGEASA